MSAEQCPHCSTRFVVAAAANAASPGPKTDAPTMVRARTDAPRTDEPTTEGAQADATSQAGSGAETTGPAARTKTTSFTTNDAITVLALGSQASAARNTDADEQTQRAEKEKKTPASAQPRHRRFPWWLIALLLLIALGGAGIYYYLRQQHEASEEQAYRQLQSCTELQTFQDFMLRFPDSKHAASVRARVDELQRIDRAWSEACNSQSADRLRQFLDSYPSSLHRAAALRCIDSLDWRVAQKQDDAAAYDKYIKTHQSGEYITQAYAAYDVAVRREAQAQAQQDSLDAQVATAGPQKPIGH